MNTIRIEPSRLALIVALAALALISLTSCASVDETYREADALTYQAIAPSFIEYVDRDAMLDEDQRELSLATLSTWRARLIAAGVAADELERVPE